MSSIFGRRFYLLFSEEDFRGGLAEGIRIYSAGFVFLPCPASQIATQSEVFGSFGYPHPTIVISRIGTVRLLWLPYPLYCDFSNRNVRLIRLPLLLWFLKSELFDFFGHLLYRDSSNRNVRLIRLPLLLWFLKSELLDFFGHHLYRDSSNRNCSAHSAIPHHRDVSNRSSSAHFITP